MGVGKQGSKSKSNAANSKNKPGAGGSKKKSSGINPI